MRTLLPRSAKVDSYPWSEFVVANHGHYERNVETGGVPLVLQRDHTSGSPSGSWYDTYVVLITVADEPSRSGHRICCVRAC